MSTIDYYNWRYATKEFNSEKKITNSDLEIIKESIRLSPSSYGLQLFKVFIIESQKLKDKLRIVSFNQSQISDASHLFVFCNYTKVIEKDIDLYIQNKSLIQQMPITKNEGYGVFLKKNLLKKETEETSIWTNNQVYIALANLMTTCASLKIDSPNTIAYKLTSASSSLKMAKTDTGSVAEIKDPKAKDSLRVNSGD